MAGRSDAPRDQSTVARLRSEADRLRARSGAVTTVVRSLSRIVLGAVVIASVCPAPVAVAAPHAALGELLEQNCHLCHGPLTQTAGVNFAGLVSELPLVRNRELWERVIGAIEVGKMPPPGAPPLTAAARARLLALLRREIEEFDYSSLAPNPGFELMRRLTHTQYDNTIRDLFGVELRGDRSFPHRVDGLHGVREFG